MVMAEIKSALNIPKTGKNKQVTIREVEDQENSQNELNGAENVEQNLNQ